MTIFLILALLVAIVAVIFAVQNVAPVTITLFAWSIDTSLAVALLVALGAGVLITLLLSLPGWLKGKISGASGRKKFTSLEGEKNTLKQKLDEVLAERDRLLERAKVSEQEILGLKEQIAGLAAEVPAREEVPTPTPGVEPPAVGPADLSGEGAEK